MTATKSVDASRRQALRLMSSAMVTACVTGCSRIPIAQQAYLSLTAPSPSPDQYPVTAEAVAASPFAAIGAQFEGQPKVVMTLATVTERRLDWVSSNHIVLTTSDERLVSSRGLPVDLRELSVADPPSPMALLPGQMSDAIRRQQRSGVPGAPDRWVDVRSRYRNLGDRRIGILGITRNVWLIEEEADYSEWRWQALNRYWIDPKTRFAWRSRQSFTPEVGALTLEVLKPYG